MDAMREAELRELFKDFDKNGDGRITCEELEFALLQLGEKPSSMHIEKMIQQADTDGNGWIDIDEFLSVLRQQIVDPSEEKELREVFKVFDADGDGVISIGELLNVMKDLGEHLTENEGRKMIKEGDVDNDGKIDFQEFVLLIKRRN